MSVLVWKFLDSVMYRDVKLSDDNAGSVKCKHVWDIGVQLECIKKALSCSWLGFGDVSASYDN